ncbi:MAG: hypothetical protein EOP88_04860 [Verrucomicrobiaceae bacterium]|nr:MAG: hypothetical protein EOP88_04860 [Verrucomicrobiaceae bacterium]
MGQEGQFATLEIPVRLMIKNPISWLLASAALVTESSAQSVTHRWNFNSTGAATNGTVIPDQISGATGTIVGINAARTGSQLTLPGGTNGQQGNTTIAAYFDLPNGIVSSKTNFTIETWATIHTSRSWQRIFDFGRMNINGSGGGEVSNTSGNPAGATSRDNLMLVAQRGDTINDKKIVARNDEQGEIGFDNSIATSFNTQYHYVATYQANPDPATGGRFTWFRNGTQQGFVDTNFPLSAISDVNNWLGRSQYTNDQNSNISYNEFRLYDYALTHAQITASGTAGPDQFPLPVAVADSVTMRHENKAKFPVLKNDTGEISVSSFTLLTQPTSGTAVITPDRQVLYTHTAGAPATDTFTYQIQNTSGQSSTGTVTINFTDALKISNGNLYVPAAPPVTQYAVPNAFNTLTFNQPVCMATPPGETQRLFVCEKGGLLRVITNVTTANPPAPTFLNLPSVLSGRGEAIDTGSECGLLGLAFHPQYAANRFFYIFYSVTKSGARYQRVSRFTTQSGNPNLADTGSEKILIEQLDDRDNHNGGDLHFGPTDGYLYISVGDEGSGNDDPVFNSQRIDKDLFSGILRIDVDRNMSNSVEPTPHASIPLESGVARFAIPKTNPFVLPADGGNWNGSYNGATVSGAVRREFWATGLRNPWRMSFDPVTNILWCADVGQGAREEVNKIIRGGNYGWVYREGTIAGPRTTNPTMPANFDALYHSPPLYDYPRGGNFGGYSVTGGRVYRGTGLPALTGKYIFADYGSGNLWAMNQEGAGNGSGIQRLLGEGGISAFGVDPSNQDLLIADIDSGVVRRLTLSSTTASSYPSTLTATGLFADVTDLSPSPGLTPYTVNLPFWSDHAIKSRWVVVPDGTSKFINNTAEGIWTFPNGTIWVKHFDMEMQRGVPSSKKRIETRLIVKNSTGAYGVSYRWNETGTEATLAADAGENFTLAVTENGNPVPQTWRIPSRAECMICHTQQAGYALSFNTRQLNLQNDISGIIGNQLTTFHQQDYFTTDPGSPNLLPRHLRPDEAEASVEARVRSYLAVNCSYCHKSGGTAPSSWDGRANLTLAQTNLVNGTANNSGGDPLNKLVVPGDTAHSIVLSRMAVTNGFTRMPPLGSNVIDQQNVDLVTTWINGELNSREDYALWRTGEFAPEDPAGAPDQDPDGDGSTNAQEFLAGTDPNDGASAFRPQLAPGEENALTLSFPLPVNRSFRIETSDNLGQWTPWDVPGNEGIPVPGGVIEFNVPVTDPLRFFRVNVMEN